MNGDNKDIWEKLNAHAEWIHAHDGRIDALWEEQHRTNKRFQTVHDKLRDHSCMLEQELVGIDKEHIARINALERKMIWIAVVAGLSSFGGGILSGKIPWF